MVGAGDFSMLIFLKNHKLVLTAVIVIALAFLCTIPSLAAPKVSEQRQKLIDYALSLRGTKYAYAGRNPEAGFDCSGFVSYAVHNSLEMPLSSQSSVIYAESEHIEEADREPGDLIFFAVKGSDGSMRINHVGIYLGTYHGSGSLDGKRVFVHAASDGPRTGVIVSAIDETYWKNHFYGYARILPATVRE